MHVRALLLLYLLNFFNSQGHAQGKWTALKNTGPELSGGASVMILLSDGTVMVHSDSIPNDSSNHITASWAKLTPDSFGSYINGTWSRLSDMHDSRLYFASQVLKDGRVFIAGGEYGSGGYLAEVYDPRVDTWTPTSIAGGYFRDPNSKLLPDGRVLVAQDGGSNYNSTIIYNPDSNSWEPGGSCIGSHSESFWLKLPDNSILFVDFNSYSSERYIPSLNRWVADSPLPVMLYSYSEIGTAFLLPNGQAFFLGASPLTAIYTPSGDTLPGTWTAGPAIPDNLGQTDAPGAMMANGKILVPLGPSGTYNPPTFFYEYDYLSNSFTNVGAPGGADSLVLPVYTSNMLDLPDGSVLVSTQNSSQFYVYTPVGPIVASGKPTITSVIQNKNTYTMTGTLFNGISEGTGYGDDWQMASNYPLVRLSSGGKVYYARSFNWNSTGVQTGNLSDTVEFTLPSGLPAGLYYVVAVANGIPSDSVAFKYYPCLKDSNAISFLSATAGNDTLICSGAPLYLSASATGGTGSLAFAWMPGNLTGSNPAVQPSANTNYTVTVSDANGCNSTAAQSVAVKALPVISISGNANETPGIRDTLTAHGGLNYIWSNGSTNDTAIVYPSVNSVYKVTGIDISGCMDTSNFSVVIIPLGINDGKSICSVLLYPDPAANLLNLKFAMPELPLTAVIKITDIFGNEVLCANSVLENDNVIPMDVSALPHGMFFVNVAGPNYTRLIKFIKD